MPFFPRPPVQRRVDGLFELRFTEDERNLLRSFLEQLRDMLLADDPLLRRLFPPAYLDESEHEADYQKFMKGDLLEARFAAIESVESTLDESVVNEATLSRWMQSINSLRLVLGTRLDVSEDGHRIDADDPDYQLYVLYETLGWMLTHIVDALTGALLPPTPD